jgi:thiamine kinase-like enzyme
VSVDAVLESVPELRDASSVEELSGGLTNTNYKVATATDTYVIRIAGRETELLGIDRANEVHNTIAAAETGIGAHVIASLPEHSALVLEFIEGTRLHPSDLRDGDRLAQVADACRRLHAGRRFLLEFDMFDLQRRYLATVRERGFRLPNGYLELEPRIRRLEEAMRVRPERRVPCNNDLLAENFIDTGEELRLIDYEYSGNNEPSFELGNSWSESRLSLDQLDELVACYYGAPYPDKIARARLWGVIAKYGWMLWASIQDGVSEIDFDFWSWGLEKYERAVEELDGPQFAQLLKDVTSASSPG